MNSILLSIIGLLAIFIAGVITYGVLGKGYIGEDSVKLTPGRFVIAAIGMFVIAYAFQYLFKNVTLGDASGVTKGIELGLLVSVPFFAVPLFADAPYFKAKSGVEWVVILNWILSFVLLGIVVGIWA
jgi:hypothetical protein